jgi:hypothetical protein
LYEDSTRTTWCMTSLGTARLGQLISSMPGNTSVFLLDPLLPRIADPWLLDQ